MKKIQGLYNKFISVCYFIGSVLHLLDLLDLRIKYSEMNSIWKSWIVYLFIADFIAAIGLWKNKTYGAILFFIIAASQIVAYTVFVDRFSPQPFLIYFHFITIIIYLSVNHHHFLQFAKNRQIKGSF